MPTIPLGLRCLKHPLSLAAIGLLLLNDHVLKASFPSTLTGKLSDFAGLFFFPFLLAAVLTLVLRGLQTRPRLAAALAFGLTGAVFALVKTSPAANALFSEFLAQLYGSPVQVVRDPTDLLALLSFGPALLLWQHEERQDPQPLGKLAYLAVGVAVLASAATTCMPDLIITRVLSVDGRLYTADLSKWPDISFNETWFAQSEDRGRTWDLVQPQDLPAGVVEHLMQPAQLPLTICETGNSQSCYRLTGKPQVEGSKDGGQTWQVIWKIPPGRQLYIELWYTRLPICGHNFDPGPYDLALYETADGVWLVAASGEQGVLVRNPDGKWQRHRVLHASPAPYVAESLLEMMIFWPEGLATLVWVFCVMTYLSRFTWINMLENVPENIRKSTREFIFSPITIAGWLILGFCLILVLISLGLPFTIFLFSPYTLPLILFVYALGFSVSWWRLAKLSAKPVRVYRLASISVGSALSCFLLAGVFSALWAFGVIPFYGVSLTLFVLATLRLLFVARRTLKQESLLIGIKESGGGGQTSNPVVPNMSE